MHRLLLKGLAIVLISAAVAVPAASARSSARAQLSLLPLPKSAIGRAAKSLPLESDSGVATNRGPVERGLLLTPTHSLAAPAAARGPRLGRIGGYVLDYGLGASGGAGVTEVWTSVDEYKTSAGAKEGLAFWKSYDRLPPPHDETGVPALTVVHKPEKVAAVGSRRFAFFVGFRAANIAPVFGLDEQFTEGRYEAEVLVWAGTAAAAKTLAPKLATKLDARIRQAMEGKLHARPVTLPPKQQPGPPEGGPDLGPLALRTSDLNGRARLLGEAYLVDWFNPTALSDLQLALSPAGPFGQIVQNIEWCPTANQASFMADLWTALDLNSASVSQLDLAGVGDGAQGVISSYANEAQLVFASGQLVETLNIAGADGKRLQASDLQALAQTVANHINNAGLGS